MSTVVLQSLASVFARVPDRRARRGVRPPLNSLSALVFLGLSARIRELAVLQRWAEPHRPEWKGPLGFTRDERADGPAESLVGVIGAVSAAPLDHRRRTRCSASVGGGLTGPQLRPSRADPSESERYSRRFEGLPGERPRTKTGGRDGRKKGAACDRRRLRLERDDADYVRDTWAYPGARIILRVDRDVTADDGRGLLSDTRYFPTSPDPGQVSAAELLATARAHRQIENGIFFIQDRWWDEDRRRTIRPGVAEWSAQLTTAALTVLRLLGPAPLPIRGRADQIAWKPRLGLELLGLT